MIDFLKYDLNRVNGLVRGFTSRRTSLRENLVSLKRGFTLIGSSLRKHHISVQGFTLIELLVVISIIGVLIAISFVGFQKSREAARDGRRKADLETLRSALELYRNECGVYPAAAWIGAVGATLTDCSGNTLVQSRPGDPANPTRVYDYEPAGGGYKLCTSLEIVATGYDVTSCSCGTACNYSAKNP